MADDVKVPVEGDAKIPEAERRKGSDRRSGDDRRGGGGAEERRTGISVSRSFRRPSFFDHPVWVGLTVLVGIALGVGMMTVTDWGVHRQKRGIEMTIVPDGSPQK